MCICVSGYSVYECVLYCITLYCTAVCVMPAGVRTGVVDADISNTVGYLGIARKRVGGCTEGDVLYKVLYK